ncbi:hypothetical protein ACFYVL_14170 [Streptomyces sp. NPDC004111]|uniref:hypothetical protein n=1 Tax=Streptomyces sp. NPDC004111 TaxID=3364690 RepID=UPI00367E83AC
MRKVAKGGGLTAGQRAVVRQVSSFVRASHRSGESGKPARELTAGREHAHGDNRTINAHKVGGIFFGHAQPAPKYYGIRGLTRHQAVQRLESIVAELPGRFDVIGLKVQFCPCCRQRPRAPQERRPASCQVPQGEVHDEAAGSFVEQSDPGVAQVPVLVQFNERRETVVLAMQ